MIGLGRRTRETKSGTIWEDGAATKITVGVAKMLTKVGEATIITTTEAMGAGETKAAIITTAGEVKITTITTIMTAGEATITTMVGEMTDGEEIRIKVTTGGDSMIAS